MKNMGRFSKIKLTVLVYLLFVGGILLVVNACNKSKNCKQQSANQNGEQTVNTVASPLEQGLMQTKVVSVMSIMEAPDGSETWVNFKELEEQFSVTDVAIVASLKQAQNASKAVAVTYDPWKGLVTKVSAVSERQLAVFNSRTIVKRPGTTKSIDLATANPDIINNPVAMGVINTTSPATGLTDVVPDMATAQLMFDYLQHQCCRIPGPYGVDHCITFQYCQDGCYARAHKMCYVINNRYHYATHKIFSFAYPSAYTLSVKAQKWGGCCIRWWYHVAPLVNIKTPSGVKAYVFDPAMFDQPVLLATWLHAQQNPACAGSRIPRVTSYNIQPTTSYAPNDTASFVTDPLYTDTDATLVSYHSLISCP